MGEILERTLSLVHNILLALRCDLKCIYNYLDVRYNAGIGNFFIPVLRRASNDDMCTFDRNATQAKIL